MADNYKLVGTVNPHTDWTSEIKLEDGKTISSEVPVELSSDQKEQVEKLGYKVERVNKSDAEEARDEAERSGGSDTSATAPVFGTSEAPDQAREVPDNPRNRR